MRILFIAPFGRCRKQTLPRRILPLAQGLVGRGHSVQVLMPAWDCPDDAGRQWSVVSNQWSVISDQWSGGGDAEVLVRAPRLGPRLHPFVDPMLAWRMWQAARAFRPDLVHVFKPLGYAGLTADLLRRGGLPVLVDIDDLESQEGWERARGPVTRTLVTVQERRMLRTATGISAASVTLQARASHLRGWRDEVLYLPNGVELASKPAPVARNEPIVVVYTRGNDVDADRIGRLWLSILAQAPAARLRIVGDWSDAPPLPASEHLGWQAGDDLATALRSAALCLFAVEDSPQVRAKSPARLLDCLAHGLPIVAADVGEYGALVGAERCVGPDDDHGLAAATARLLCAPALRAEWGRQSWQRAQGHTWAPRVKALEAWYGRLMKSEAWPVRATRRSPRPSAQDSRS